MEHFQITPTVFGAIASTEAANHSCYIRLLKQEDEDELCRIFLTLEPSARCCRFGQVASDAYLVNHAKRSLTDADWIIGAFVGERLRGLVEVYSGRPSSYAEAAFVVEQEWRRRGLGWALLQAAIQKAGASGADTLGTTGPCGNSPAKPARNSTWFSMKCASTLLCVDQPKSTLINRHPIQTAAKTEQEGGDHGGRPTSICKQAGSRGGEIVRLYDPCIGRAWVACDRAHRRNFGRCQF